MSRWAYQYQRIADVLQQRVEQMEPDRCAGHERFRRRSDGHCYVCAAVDAAPPLTQEQICKLAALLAPVRQALRTAQNTETKARRKVKR